MSICLELRQAPTEFEGQAEQLCAPLVLVKVFSWHGWHTPLESANPSAQTLLATIECSDRLRHRPTRTKSDHQHSRPCLQDMVSKTGSQELARNLLPCTTCSCLESTRYQRGRHRRRWRQLQLLRSRIRTLQQFQTLIESEHCAVQRTRKSDSKHEDIDVVGQNQRGRLACGVKREHVFRNCTENA